MLHVDFLIFGCVVTLAAIQIPIDIRKRQLSRLASLAALFGIISVSAGDAAVTGSHRKFAMSVVLALLVSGLYFVLHRYVPNALGLGDAILVSPLACAVTYTNADSLVIWQFMAATSGAIHALFVRARWNQESIPFGPHLLASSVLIIGLGI